jgi:hypothetical protein
MTYGQIAFEAYVRDCSEVCVLGDEEEIWAGQDPHVQGHWEAAARAVRQVPSS